MYQSINIDKAAELLINIVDSNRCTICDTLDGIRMRYPCGHTSCEDCVPATESCALCLTPQDSSAFAAPSLDKPLTQRSQSAKALLNAFETEFAVDVYKRHRISEQLKIEKDLFPQCIQAPAKYYNKRKSSKRLTENNAIINYPGEEVSSFNKMENSNAIVREWLTKCTKRKPLGDLNLNVLQKQPPKVQNMLKDRSHRKRSHTEIWADENESVNDLTPRKKLNKRNASANLDNKEVSIIKPQISIKDDSGILDDDDVCVIDDSLNVPVDKDMNAWLAVLEAEKYAQCDSTTLGSKKSELARTEKITIPVKVPFYKKSPLFPNCKYCNEYYKTVDDNRGSEDLPNVSITVESKAFTTVINVSKVQNTNKVNTKKSIEVQSIEVQTDFNIEDIGNKVQDSLSNEVRVSDIIALSPTPSSCISKDKFLGEANINPGYQFNKSSNVIIAESDSDTDIEHSTSLQVIADVHRSYDEIEVLGDVEDLEEHSKRPRRAARGHTPTSTDSSDKENYNPNRKKRSADSKKKPMKK